MGTPITLRLGDREFVADVDPAGNVAVDDIGFSLSTLPDGSVRLDGAGGTQRGWMAASADTVWVFLDGRVFAFERQRPGTRRKRGGAHHGSLSAPMPATVRRIDVKAGDAVKKGQTLILLEAMKMELPVRAAGDGTVTSVNCREGELVQPGATLVELDEAD
jgi:biotin carboxyl carrier protein